APGPLTVCRSKVSGFYFTPLPGCFSPFPHGTLHYRSPRVFSLTQWSVRIPPGFRVSRGTRVSLRRPVSFRLQGCHLLWRRFPPSETVGSSFASNSPTLIAGSRVFLRLLVRRHPPRTLTSLFDL